MKRILAIGNSFSVDALHFFKDIADTAGTETETGNLYIGGCSLRQHWENAESDVRSYEYYRNGQYSGKYTSIREALLEGPWDIVTLQQVSYESGKTETYEPYGSNLIRYVRYYAPNAELWFHKTWAYEHDSDHVFFHYYNKNQMQMYHKLCAAGEAFAQRHNLAMIPSADVIQRLRELPEFNVTGGGRSLCRDGFHMSMDYGRYAVAAAWFECLLGEDVRRNCFAPPETDLQLICAVQRVVHEVCLAEKERRNGTI